MKKTVVEYRPTNKIAMVYGTYDNATSYDMQLAGKMVKVSNVNHGSYKIYVNDIKEIYNNLFHVYAKNKKNLIEVNAIIKDFRKLDYNMQLWTLAYIDQNNLVANYRLNDLVVSAFIDKNNVPENFSYLSQLFKNLTFDLNASYNLIDYDEKGSHNDITLNDYHSIVKALQAMYRQSITNDIYLTKK